MSIRVLSWVFDHSPVKHRGDLLTLLVLADHASDDGDQAYPSIATIARKARLSERGARNALRNLEAAGAIKPTGRGPRGTVSYRVLITPAVAAGAVAAPRQLKASGGQSPTEKVSLTAPEPSLEPSIEPSGTRAGARTALTDYDRVIA